MSTPEIQAVIFDCDGTLVDSEPISQQVLVELFESLGLQVTHAYAMEHWAGRDLHELFRAAESQLKRSLPEDFSETFRNLQLKRLRDELKPIQGAAELLTSVNKPMCVASNAPLIKVRCCLETTCLIDFFEVNRLFSAYDVGVWKPQPDVFLYAAKEMGVRPEHCAVIEDSPCGIQAGVAAGMQVFAYAPESSGNEENDSRGASVKSVTRLDELINHLKY